MEAPPINCSRLILLPGMDGTGLLLRSFLDELGDIVPTSVISLPTGENQSYDYLAQRVRDQLPQDEPFVMLAESFSGPIAYRLLQDDVSGVASVIFVASFVKRPTLSVKLVASLIPNFALSRSFLTNKAMKALLVGFDSGEEQLVPLWEAINQTGVNTIKRRMKTIGSMQKPSQRISKPCFYVQADNDYLVPRHNFSEFQKYFDSIRLFRVKGPHLILQTKPEECAAVVREILASHGAK